MHQGLEAAQVVLVLLDQAVWGKSEGVTMSDEPSGEPEVSNYLTSRKSFLLEAPLYYDFDLTKVRRAEVTFHCLTYSDPIDAYCLECRKETPFACRPDPFLEKLSFE